MEYGIYHSYGAYDEEIDDFSHRKRSTLPATQTMKNHFECVDTTEQIIE